MDNQQQFGNWLSYENQSNFSDFPVWNHQLESPFGEVIDAIPLTQCYHYSDPFFPTKDLFQDEFSSIFDAESGFWDDMRVEGSEPKKEKSISIEYGKEKRGRASTKERKVVERSAIVGEEKVLTFEEVSQYFYMPITQAAKELNVGLTLLKKKCRALGIPRWPHRKMKSLQTLIRNVQELGREEGEEGEAQARSAIELLEQEKKLMEKAPAMQLEEKTKRLRQACFKVNYKKRRLMAIEGAESSPNTPNSV